MEFNINIRYSSETWSLHILVMHLRLLGPLLYRFKDRGMAFRVRVGNYYEDEETECRDVTWLWELPEEKLAGKVED